MTPLQRQMLIEHIVYDMYLPEIKASMEKYLNEYERNRYAQEQIRHIFPNSVIIPSGILQVGEASKRLVENLMVVFDDDLKKHYADKSNQMRILPTLDLQKRGSAEPTSHDEGETGLCSMPSSKR